LTHRDGRHLPLLALLIAHSTHRDSPIIAVMAH
jgi:hypothetical protein